MFHRSTIRLGEAVALSVLRDRAHTYNEKFTVKLKKLDGSIATISNEWGAVEITFATPETIEGLLLRKRTFEPASSAGFADCQKVYAVPPRVCFK
jgi:hypothetical protein